MQSGRSSKAIVQCLKNMNYHSRGRVVTEFKRAAQRRHRRRVGQDLQQVARGVVDAEDFDGALGPHEGLDAWDVS